MEGDVLEPSSFVVTFEMAWGAIVTLFVVVVAPWIRYLHAELKKQETMIQEQRVGLREAMTRMEERERTRHEDRQAITARLDEINSALVRLAERVERVAVATATAHGGERA
jgi:hypothetical protein